MTDTALFKEIQSLPSLHPTPLTNNAFSKLVSFCCTHDASDISLSPKDIQTLRYVSSQAEEHMEYYWAKRILAASDPSSELTEFWYRDNYTELVDLEWSHLTSIKHDIRHVLFVGGGPLPLSAIELALHHNVTCTVLEKNKDYAELATTLITRLGLGASITVVHEDAKDFTRYHEYDVVYIAALVGTTRTKTHHILSTYSSLQKGALLIARHARGARTLIYPPLSPRLTQHIKPIIEVHPETSILNSFSVLRKE